MVMDVEDEVSSKTSFVELPPVFCIEERMRATSQVVGEGMLDGIVPVPDVRGTYELMGWDIVLDDNGLPVEVRKENTVLIVIRIGATSYLTC